MGLLYGGVIFKLTHINLLPWREKKRQQERQQLITYLLVALGMAMSLVLFIRHEVLIFVERQYQRNQCLSHEIVQYEQQIKVIRDMKILRRSLLLMIKTIENIQLTRAVRIKCLVELGQLVPKMVYLNRIECLGNQVFLVGYATSTTPISTLMRRISANIWILAPSLSEVKKTKTVNEFKLNFSLKAPVIHEQMQ